MDGKNLYAIISSEILLLLNRIFRYVKFAYLNKTQLNVDKKNLETYQHTKMKDILFSNLIVAFEKKTDFTNFVIKLETKRASKIMILCTFENL